jgi:RNA polymerase sigma factor (sigma-70 family)
LGLNVKSFRISRLSGSYTSEMDERSDQQLLREYVGRGSEEAFTALVKRHTSLVYGTACRKLGDKSAAEEITQAVFVVLARKAAFLCHHANLSGWLHRTTLLECQQRIRADLRRKRREEKAMNVIEPENDSSIAQEVDEALLELSDRDRQPILMRFLESMSLRDVAVRLGIREDAAQKRVAKSLGSLERILRKRGRDIGSAALAIALAESAQAAPAYLAASAANAALAGAGAGALGLLFGKFMALSQAPAVAACVAIISAPLLLQTQRLLEERSALRLAERAVAVENERDAGLTEVIRRLQSDIAKLQTERAGFLAQIEQAQSVTKPTANLPASKLYRWSDASDYVRLPKNILEAVRLTTAKQSDLEKRYGLPAGITPPKPADEIERNDPITPKGIFSEALAEAFALKDEDRQAISQAFQQFSAKFDAIASQRTVVTNVIPLGLHFDVPKDYQFRTLVTHEFPEEGKKLKEELLGALKEQLGEERTDLLMHQGSFIFDYAFREFGARKYWVTAVPTDDGMVTVAHSQSRDDSSKGGAVHIVKPSEVPAELRPFLPPSLFTRNE